MTNFIIDNLEFYITEVELNFSDALLYCSLMNIDGKDDWRLVNYDEVSILYDNNEFEDTYLWVDDIDFNSVCIFYDEKYTINLNPNDTKFLVVAVRDI